MTAAYQVDIETWTDADYAQAFRWQMTEGPPPTFYDFTGCSMALMVRKHAEDVETFLSLESNGALVPGEPGIDIYDPGTEATAGLWEFSVVILREQLQRIPEGTYDQSLIVTDATGFRRDLWRGTLTNTIGPTR